MRSLFSIFVIAAILPVLLLSSGCERRYEQGPTLSFRSPKGRAANTWKANYITVNEYDDTKKFSNVELALNEDGTFLWDIQLPTDTLKMAGIWEMAVNNEQIRLQINNNPDVNGSLLFFEIDQLKNKALQVRFVSNFKVGHIANADQVTMQFLQK